jgi:hypothetical protein
VREVERAVAELSGRQDEGTRKKPRTVLTPRLEAIIEEMQRALGTKITLTGSEEKGSLKVEYYTSDDLTRICDKLDIEIN